MNQFIGLSDYVQKIEGERKIYNIGKDLILEISPQQKTFLIEYQDREISFRFENQQVLVKTEVNNEITRKVVSIYELEQYLKSLKLDFLVKLALKKVPFLNQELEKTNTEGSKWGMNAIKT